MSNQQSHKHIDINLNTEDLLKSRSDHKKKTSLEMCNFHNDLYFYYMLVDKEKNINLLKVK